MRVIGGDRVTAWEEWFDGGEDEVFDMMSVDDDGSGDGDGGGDGGDGAGGSDAPDFSPPDARPGSCLLHPLLVFALARLGYIHDGACGGPGPAGVGSLSFYVALVREAIRRAGFAIDFHRRRRVHTRGFQPPTDLEIAVGVWPSAVLVSEDLVLGPVCEALSSDATVQIVLSGMNLLTRARPMIVFSRFALRQVFPEYVGLEDHAVGDPLWALRILSEVLADPFPANSDEVSSAPEQGSESGYTCLVCFEDLLRNSPGAFCGSGHVVCSCWRRSRFGSAS